MTLLVVNNGEEVALAYLVNNQTTQYDLIYRLYVNDITPSDTDVAGTYTEAAGGGYAAKTLTGASWTVTGGTASYADQTWTFTGPLTGNATVYGYYVTRATSGDLVLAERFVTSFTPANNGDYITITPQITAD